MKKSYSAASFALIICGLLALAVNWMASDVNEIAVLTGYILLLLGAVCGFLAFVKREAGVMKGLAVALFFVMLLGHVLIEPWMPVYILTWLGNLF